MLSVSFCTLTPPGGVGVVDVIEAEFGEVGHGRALVRRVYQRRVVGGRGPAYMPLSGREVGQELYPARAKREDKQCQGVVAIIAVDIGENSDGQCIVGCTASRGVALPPRPITFLPSKNSGNQNAPSEIGLQKTWEGLLPKPGTLPSPNLSSFGTPAR